MQKWSVLQAVRVTKPKEWNRLETGNQMSRVESRSHVIQGRKEGEGKAKEERDEERILIKKKDC